MRSKRLAFLLAFPLLLALIWPAASSAHHLRTTASVSAQVKERASANVWNVDITWTAGCAGAAAGKAWYSGDLYMIDVDTGERTYVGGVVNTSGFSSVTETREWSVSSIARIQRLRPELTIYCYENFPLHGAPTVTVTGAAITIPPLFRGGGGGSGGGGGDYGSGDPTAPVASGGCGAALLGTDAADTLTGGNGGDVIFGFDGRDRIRGKRGHDCLIGGKGNDTLRGEGGFDRLTGGRGNDVLIGGSGVNAYDAGPGNDYVNARNGRRELVRCGRGRDRARVDRRDRVISCERVSRPR